MEWLVKMGSESQNAVDNPKANEDGTDTELEILSETSARSTNQNNLLLSKDEVPLSAISAPYTPNSTQTRSPAYFPPVPTDISMDFDDESDDDDDLGYVSMPEVQNVVPESQEKSSIKQKFQSQTSLVFYLGIETNQCNKREQRLNLVKYAKVIEQLAKKTFNNPEIRASLTLPKLTTETIQIYKEESENQVDIDEKDNLSAEVAQLPNRDADLKIDMNKKRVWINQFEVKLTPREFSLLTHLIEASNKPVSRAELLENIWNTTDFRGKSRTVDVHIRRLRDKLHNQIDLKTIRGTGYKFVGENNIIYV
ncbi:MAG: winged helix-turn-helix domain-containing protein [Bifidobacteriaceae bacterium]|nr:winged helix-turn-helix domain-containing protein [Bifidobacteriaceae bacterium]